MSTKRTSLTVPPAPAPTRGDSEQIVEAIIGAAMVLPESASLKDIAECAGVGSASLHRYFPTKGALYAELARRVQRRTLEALRSIMADQSLSVDRALEAMCSMAVFLPQPLRRTLDLAVPFAWTEEHAAKTFAACIEEIAAWLSQRLTQAPDDLRLRVFAAFA